MKQSVTFSDFTKAFHDMDRKDNFSYDALRVLFDWFEELEQDCDVESELDVIAICCEYSEDSWQDIAENYSVDLTECEDDAEREGAVLEHLTVNTTVCGVTDQTIVFQQY